MHVHIIHINGFTSDSDTPASSVLGHQWHFHALQHKLLLQYLCLSFKGVHVLLLRTGKHVQYQAQCLEHHKCIETNWPIPIVTIPAAITNMHHVCYACLNLPWPVIELGRLSHYYKWTF